MNVICSPKGSGKTTQLIKRAEQTNGYIVCCDMERASAVSLMAINLGVTILYPLTFNEFLDRRYVARSVHCFLVDDVDLLVQKIACGVPVDSMTVSAG